MSERSLDVFCHCLPPAYCDAADRLADRSPPLMFGRARAIPAMVDVEARLRLMDRFPGYEQVLSLASPTPEALVAPARTPELARVGNDAMAEMVAAHGDRFRGFIATLPMSAPEAALAEAERAVRELDAAGVQLYTNVAGRPLDEPELLRVVERVAELGRPLWLHPIRPMTTPDYPTETVSKYDLWWAFGWPYETSLAMGRLVFAGVFDRWPDLAIITHHVGGMVPLMEGRLGPGLDLLGTRNPPEHSEAVATALKERPLDAFRRFHADTASFGSGAAIACGLAFFGVERVLFATDMPFDPEGGAAHIRTTLAAIRELELSPDERASILYRNAARLLRLGDGSGDDVQGTRPA